MSHFQLLFILDNQETPRKEQYSFCRTKETKITRHGNMLVGGTLGGKSVCWKTLAKAKCILKSMGQEGALSTQGWCQNGFQEVQVSPALALRLLDDQESCIDH